MYLYIFILCGLVLAAIFGVSGIQDQRWYSLMVATLLAAGLYSSTYDIQIKTARSHLALIVRAVTVGVILKAFIIGCILTLVLKDLFGFVLGIIVAQIDPLATTVLMKGKRMSTRAKAVLSAWSSFDDPMTVLLSLYVPVIIATVAGTHWEPIQGTLQSQGASGYLLSLGVNVLFAGGLYVAWQFIKRHAKTANYIVVSLVVCSMYMLLLGAISLAVYYFWMLGIALAGLFMRPPIEKLISNVAHWALGIAGILLGMLLINGVDIKKGIILGVAAYISQVIVGLLLTRQLSVRDRLHLAFAQQNGITAIILALLFEPYYPGTIAVVGPAIIVINVIHAIANKILDLRLDNNTDSFRCSYYMNRLKNHIRQIG